LEYSKSKRIMDIFHKVLEDYKIIFEKNGKQSSAVRLTQLNEITEILSNHFPFDVINCIETGASCDWEDGVVGYYFANLSHNTKGNFYSVDNNPNLYEKTFQTFNDIAPHININHTTSDSVEYIKNTKIVPNLVHLDSWDLDLKNPFPSALHGWKEFEAIESKMPIGSIIIIDDNFYGGTWQTWSIVDNKTKKVLGSERIDIIYPLVGKGSHIYQWALREDTNWKVLNDSRSGNVKIVIQKTY